MTFADCVAHCASNADFVSEFNRLTGCKLGQSAERSNIEIMIDEATGYAGESDADMAMFVDAVYDVIWCRLVQETN